tara:strand:+ start:1122 stop:2372 length:1251 start_codon:yes stop_codon:yes gene_type:complete
MGISLRGIGVGFMERGSEIIQQEMKSAEDLIDSSIKMWTDMGLPVYRARKKQRRELEQVADFLKGKGFSNDQIYTAMRQGQHQSVVDYVKKYETSTKKAFGATGGPSAADIITFGGDYKDTGMTMDQVLDGVMGKVTSGMGMADAIADATGQKLSGIQGNIMKKRAESLSAAFGVDPAELMQLASGDFEYGEKLGGTISMPGTGTTKLTGQAGRYGRFFRLFGNELGFKADYDSVTNSPVYPEEAKQKAGEAMLLATEGNVIVAKLMQENPNLTVEEAEQQAAQQILKRLRSPQENDTVNPEDPPADPENPPGTRTDSTLNEEETAKLDALSQQITAALDPAFGLPQSDEARATQLQQLVNLYMGFGFPADKARQMAQFQYDLILQQKSDALKEQERIDQQRNIPPMPGGSEDPMA